MKKLKIKFWKAEKALAMQILEQEGLSEVKDNGVVRIYDFPMLNDDAISLRGAYNRYDSYIATHHFNSDELRDEYLKKITQAITDELFTGTGELKVGEMCEVWNDDCRIWQQKLLAILPETQSKRYITEWTDEKELHASWMQARPLSKRTEPTVEENGEIVTYTWEEDS